MTGLRVTHAATTQAGARDRDRGLLAFLTVILNDSIALDGVTLRRSADGRVYVSYPARTDRAGGRHPYLRPLDERARLELESQILAALKAEGAT